MEVSGVVISRVSIHKSDDLIAVLLFRRRWLRSSHGKGKVPATSTVVARAWLFT